MVVKVKEGKTPQSRTFTIIQTDDMPMVSICKQYFDLRPKTVKTHQFFIKYSNGKCFSQPVGINTIGKVPFEIATYLQLENPQNYTGHCFRRSSATLLADGGGDILSLKRHGGWRSSTVAEGYVQNSIQSKINTEKRIFGEITNNSISEEQSTAVNIGEINNSIQHIPVGNLNERFNLSNCSNFTIIINPTKD